MNFKHLTFKHIKLDKIDSTNSYLYDLNATTKQINGTVISAKNQTLGKGQTGNTWHTEEDKNLTFSVLTYTNTKPKHAFYLNIIASLAVQKALSDLNITAKIKWPNDILVNQKKIAGILIENQINGDIINQSIIGIGLNVNQSIFNSELNATSILNEGISVEIEDVLNQIYGYLDFYYNLLLESNFKLLLKHYYTHLFWHNQIGTFKNETSEFKALVMGISDIGLLELRLLDNTTKYYDIKDVKFLY
jgi:BirA family biotin operon repressor/biotin-[acetyl-CoA-carboxylase] ligase